MANPNFSKFTRPEQPFRGPITERDLDILDAVLRFRFCSAAQLVRLAGGNEDVTHRRLRRLWERGLISRWAFPGIRSHSEFYYYLDSREPVDLLAQCRGLVPHSQMLDEIKNNRQKDYAGAAQRGQHMQLGFLEHSLQISRMHFMVEMACRKSAGSASLEAWCQGGQVTGHKVDAPKVVSSRVGSDYFWQESDELERLPVEPDALLTLRFPNRAEASQRAHFFYEADRGSMGAADMMKKFRAYYHFIKKQQKHKQAFGVHPIRAVLVETTDEARARRLMELASHPLVSGQGKRAGLFWFTISDLFTASPPGNAGTNRPLPHYLERPETVLDSIWALPDRTLHALGDAENSTAAVSAAP